MNDTKPMSLEEELEIVDKHLRKRRLKAAHAAQLLSKRDRLVKQLSKEQQVMTRDGHAVDGRPAGNQERFLNALKDPFEREVWEHVFRIEAENRANPQPQPEPQTIIPKLPEGVEVYGPEGKPATRTTPTRPIGPQADIDC
jgi:hypothetical protein